MMNALILHSKDAVAAYMVDWFLHNYEHPAENTPHDEGDYVYIWGGPVDAAEELEEEFGGVVAPDLIAAAAKTLEKEHDVYEWVPVPKREDEDDDDEPGPTYAVTAECERCGGQWSLLAVTEPPENLAGACGPCTKESEVAERPLTFRLKRPFERIHDHLPLSWLAGAI